MKKILIRFSIGLLLALNSTAVMALTDTYFATGEDIDFLEEVDSTFALREIEYKLRQFMIYRKLEQLVQAFDDDYIELDE